MLYYNNILNRLNNFPVFYIFLSFHNLLVRKKSMYFKFVILWFNRIINFYSNEISLCYLTQVYIWQSFMDRTVKYTLKYIILIILAKTRMFKIVLQCPKLCFSAKLYFVRAMTKSLKIGEGCIIMQYKTNILLLLKFKLCNVVLCLRNVLKND